MRQFLCEEKIVFETDLKIAVKGANNYCIINILAWYASIHKIKSIRNIPVIVADGSSTKKFRQLLRYYWNK